MINFKGFTWHRFWLKSARGTDISEHLYLSPDADPQDELDYWSQKKGGHLSYIEYGMSEVPMPPKKVLQSKINKMRRRLYETMSELKEYERIHTETFGEPDCE